MFYRKIKEPKNLPDSLYIYNYKIIKKYQNSTGLKDFTSVLYIALLAEIVFLYFSPHSVSEKCSTFDEMQLALGFANASLFKKIFYLPIAFTLAFIIWRAKNYIIYELPLDIDTRFDKLLDVLIPITFSFIVYYTFNPRNLSYWLFACSMFFLLTFILAIKRYVSIRSENKYRIKIPYRSKHYAEYNIWGFRAQLGRWALLLGLETALIIITGLIVFFITWFVLFNQNHWINKILNDITSNSNYKIIIIMNYLIGIIICLVIYYMTLLSKSVRPISIEAYEKEMESEISKMSYGEDYAKNKFFRKKWPLLKIQYRALKYLRKSDINDETYQNWKNEMDNYL